MSQRYQCIDRSRRGHRFISRSGAFGHAPDEFWTCGFILSGGTVEHAYGYRIGLKHLNRAVTRANFYFVNGAVAIADDYRVVTNRGLVELFNRQGLIIGEYDGQAGPLPFDSQNFTIAETSGRSVAFDHNGDVVITIRGYSGGNPVAGFRRLSGADLSVVSEYLSTNHGTATFIGRDGTHMHFGSLDRLDRVTSVNSTAWSVKLACADVSVHPAGGVVVVGGGGTDQWQGAGEGEYADVWRVTSSGGITTHAYLGETTMQPDAVVVTSDGRIFVAGTPVDGLVSIAELNSSFAIINSVNLQGKPSTSAGIVYDLALNADESEIYLQTAWNYAGAYDDRTIFRLDLDLNELQKSSGLWQAASVAIPPDMKRGAPATPHM